MHDPHVEAISPELVLVDPELAAGLRATVVAKPKPLLEAIAATERQRAAAQEEAAARAAVALHRSAQSATDAPPAAAPAPPALVSGGVGAYEERRRAWKRIPPRWELTAACLAVTALLGAAFLPPRQAPQLGTTMASAAQSPPTLVWPAR